MPKKPVTRNGHAICFSHPQADTLCRSCVVEGLHEFRQANFRAGLNLAIGKIRRLQAQYAARNGGEVRTLTVACDLGVLLANLGAAGSEVEAQPFAALGLEYAQIKRSAPGH